MKKIDRFVNQYTLSKTLRFSLIPQGKTKENFENAKLLEEDEKRAEEYKKVKEYIDRYHKMFIERVLTGFILPDLDKYSELYFKKNKSATETKQLSDIEQSMRTAISKRFQKDQQYKGLFEKEMIRDFLPSVLNEEEKKIAGDFNSFTTYFTGFNENRKNMYTGEGHATEIAFRIVNQNLPRFLDNCHLRDKVLSVIPVEKMTCLKEHLSVCVEDIFELSYFNRAMRQSQIDIYNQIIGGFTEEDGTKVKGINEYINEYNQISDVKIAKLKPLYKQILSDRSTVSFIPEKFADDQELLSAISNAYDSPTIDTQSLKSLSADLLSLLSRIGQYDLSKIYVKSGACVSSVSKYAFSSWDTVRNGLVRKYDSENGNAKAKNPEKYIEKRESYFKNIESISLHAIQSSADEFENQPRIEAWFAARAAELTQMLAECYADVKTLLDAPYPSDRKLSSNDADVGRIKAFLDCLKDIQSFAGLVLGSGKEADKDEVFYGEFLPKYDAFSIITPLYDKVRNFVTKKPYCTEKVKLNFDCCTFLNGWDVNKETQNLGVLMLKGGKYYLGVMGKAFSKVFEKTTPCTDGHCYQKVIYKYFKDVTTMIPKCSVAMKEVKEHFTENDSDYVLTKKFNSPFVISKEIYDLATITYNGKKKFQKDYCRQTGDKEGYADAVRKWICFCVDFLKKYSSTSIYNYDSIYPLEQFTTYDGFISEVNKLLYAVSYAPISEQYINSLVDKGNLYLFQIYNKDFSANSKGTPNLHTLYFKQLFSPENMQNTVFKLDGGAEMFYRRASISEKDRIIHPAGQKIKNKNPLSEKQTSTFTYDLIKDRRFTVDKFSLHLPITLNFKAMGRVNMNTEVRKVLHEEKKSYVIGIDRGERNLLYICVVDPDGRIVEQHSMNEIINKYNGQTYHTDYHALLDNREAARLEARRDWKTIEGIKEIKEGYVSQVVHVICQLMEKYDAVIAMEDLNAGFKNSRVCVEKQVYQKFEKMLIDKLNFYADKHKEPEEIGGLLNAYQLTNKFESFAKMGKQNGFIFYIPAWLTSKIDPTTGFADLLKPKYESVANAQAFFEKFDRIAFNRSEGFFEFDLDYSKFPRGETDYRKKWTLCSQGTRIETFRNAEKNSNWDTREIDLTEELHQLFIRYGIDESAQDLRPQIISRTEKEFFVRLTKLLSLILQMRNSVPNSAIDYLISPVKNASGRFFNSNDADENLPADADANGAYHIALKALWAIQQISDWDGDLYKVKLAISNREWLQFAQSRCE